MLKDQSKAAEIIIAQNQLLVDALRIGEYTHILNGSNRQNRNIDSINTYKYFPTVPSAKNKDFGVFAFMQALTRALTGRNVTMVPVLLADLDYPEGKNFVVGAAFAAFTGAHGVDSNARRAYGGSSFADGSKILLVYMQLHELARANPNADIEYTFIDDNEGILTGLHAFFSGHPDFIPQNIKKINFLKYDGSRSPELFCEVDCSKSAEEHKTDANYAITLKTFIANIKREYFTFFLPLEKNTSDLRDDRKKAEQVSAAATRVQAQAPAGSAAGGGKAEVIFFVNKHTEVRKNDGSASKKIAFWGAVVFALLSTFTTGFGLIAGPIALGLLFYNKGRILGEKVERPETAIPPEVPPFVPPVPPGKFSPISTVPGAAAVNPVPAPAAVAPATAAPSMTSST